MKSGACLFARLFACLYAFVLVFLLLPLQAATLI